MAYSSSSSPIPVTPSLLLVMFYVTDIYLSLTWCKYFHKQWLQTGEGDQSYGFCRTNRKTGSFPHVLYKMPSPGEVETGRSLKPLTVSLTE